MQDVIAVLHRAADLTLTHGPDPLGCIRAAVYGRPDVMLPLEDTTESLLVEDAEYWLQIHINPDSPGADEDIWVDEWADGKTVVDVLEALLNTADQLQAGAR